MSDDDDDDDDGGGSSTIMVYLTKEPLCFSRNSFEEWRTSTLVEEWWSD